MDDILSLSDDDDDDVTVITEIANDVIETIDLDDLPSSQNSASENLNDNTAVAVYTSSRVPNIFNGLYRENPVLANFIELCLDLENSQGMTRIINNTLMKIYSKLDHEYRCSEELKKLIQKATSAIETDPDHKFSHLRTLCEGMKYHKFRLLNSCQPLKPPRKKRVQLITLATGLKKRQATPPTLCKGPKAKVPKTNNVISIDSDDEIVLNNDESAPNNEERVLSNNENILTNDKNDNNIVIDLDELQSDKENQLSQQNSLNSELNGPTEHSHQDNELLEPQVEVVQPDIRTYAITEVLPVEFEPNREDETKMQMIPVEFQPYIEGETKMKIALIEAQIAKHKANIQRLDEAEVLVDSHSSPYILSEWHKEQVVKLYKNLCKLTGHSPVKKRKIRLQVLEGHPAGPVKKLEKFLNENVGEDGAPIFPDMCDVVNCVIEANVEDSLGWSRQNVMKEATALFVHCGRALQKRRQHREYSDLMTLIKQEDHDPADDDLELRARLEANRRIGQRKENELFERYARMQDLPPSTTASHDEESVLPVQAANTSNVGVNNGPNCLNKETTIKPQVIAANTSHHDTPRIENVTSQSVQVTTMHKQVEYRCENNLSETQTLQLNKSTQIIFVSQDSNRVNNVDAITNVGEVLNHGQNIFQKNQTEIDNRKTLSNTQTDTKSNTCRDKSDNGENNISETKVFHLDKETQIICVSQDNNSVNNVEGAVFNHGENISQKNQTEIETRTTLSPNNCGDKTVNTTKDMRQAPNFNTNEDTIALIPGSELNNHKSAVTIENRKVLYSVMNLTEYLVNLAMKPNSEVNLGKDSDIRTTNSTDTEVTLTNTPELAIDTNSKVTASNRVVKSDIPIEIKKEPAQRSEVNLVKDSDIRKPSGTDITVEIETNHESTFTNTPESTIDTNSEVLASNGEDENDIQIEIKKEPAEILIEKLEDLGDNYTVSILDIEDPFVSIEISDSSDDEA